MYLLFMGLRFVGRNDGKAVYTIGKIGTIARLDF